MEKTGIQKTGFRIILALLILTGALSYTLRYIKVEPDSMPDFSLIPMSKAGWTAEEFQFPLSTLEILKATETTMRVYLSDLPTAPALFIGYFEDQKYGSQIHSPRHCLPGSGWGILSHTQRDIDIDGVSLPINHVVIGNKDNLQLMYYWFETRSGKITGEFSLKFNLFLNALMMKPTDAAFIRLTVNLPPGWTIKQGEEILESYLSDFFQDIENSLPFNS